MNKPILAILGLAILLARGSGTTAAPEAFSSYDRARLHPLTCDRPEPDFFAGALLGNGAMGVVVTTRPDAVVLYFGHNNVWDIRLAEDNRDKIGTFKDVFNRVKTIPDNLTLLTDDAWYREYSRMTTENYRKPYPRPFPCGSVVLGFDRRRAEMIGHRLDISHGRCEVSLLSHDRRPLFLQIFADTLADRLWLRLVDAEGRPAQNIFERVRVLIDPSTPPEFPRARIEEALPQGLIAFRQILPAAEPDKYDKVKGHPNDRAFRLMVAVNGPLEKRSRINWDGNEQAMVPLEAGVQPIGGFLGCVALQEGLNTAVAAGLPAAVFPRPEQFTAALEQSRESWRNYWNKSGVKLADQAASIAATTLPPRGNAGFVSTAATSTNPPP